MRIGRRWHATAPAVDQAFFEIMLGVVPVPLVIPWGHVWRRYVKAPAERWR